MKYKCEVKRKLEFKEKINGIMDYVEAESKFRTKHRYDPASAIFSDMHLQEITRL